MGTQSWHVSARVTVAGDEAARKSHAATSARKGAAIVNFSTPLNRDVEPSALNIALAATGAMAARMRRVYVVADSAVNQVSMWDHRSS